MRMFNFAKRNFKELIRDPLSLVFQIVLPLFLLLTDVVIPTIKSLGLFSF